MSHTEEFNRIMGRVNEKHKNKAANKKILPVLIGERENMNELQTSIAKCRIAANVVYLPDIREGKLNNYAEVRKAFLNAGASYKNNSFIFPTDAKPYIDRLMGGESVNIKKEFQFFATPANLATYLVELANIHSPDLLVLEPSGGQGAIVKAILEYEPRLCVHTYELMDINRAILEQIKNCIVLGADFLENYPINGNHASSSHSNLTFDRIVANPPFNKNQDIEHIRAMYKRLNKGGRIVSVASNSWRNGGQKKQVQFREWLEEIGAIIEDVEAGTFKESGTNIATCIVIIDK